MGERKHEASHESSAEEPAGLLVCQMYQFGVAWRSEVRKIGAGQYDRSSASTLAGQGMHATWNAGREPCVFKRSGAMALGLTGTLTRASMASVRVCAKVSQISWRGCRSGCGQLVARPFSLRHT
jgi:diacylglycerol kinase family enzyme